MFTTRFHDGQLVGLDLSDGGLRIRCIANDRMAFHIVLGGVKRLRASNFLQGNIILDITFQRGPEADEEGVDAVLYALLVDPSDGPVAPLGRVLIDQGIATLKAGIRDSELGLFRLTSSYGCEVTAVCEACNELLG